MEARIKFQRPKGAHGAVWWQSGYSTDGAEFDVAEFFGERTGGGTQNIQQTIHKGTGPGNPTVQRLGNTWTEGSLQVGQPSESQFNRTNFATGNNDTWWTEYHVFHGVWGQTKYTYYVDDIYVGEVTNGTPSTIPGEVILSLLVSDPDEYNNLQSHLSGGGSINDYKMYVDWIRVWR